MKKNSKNKPKVVIAGIWELGWNTPIKEIELWEYPLRDFSVDAFYMTPVTGIESQFIHERNTMEEILKENKDLKVVFVDEKGEAPLKTFKHPKKALYVFGKASLSAMIAYGKKGDLSVKIETIANGGMLWPHQAAAIILYDRLKKSWQ